jgi:protease-4
MAVSGRVSGNLRTELSPLVDTGPLCEVAVPPGGADADCPRVAVIDVDGILTNFNHVGPYSVGENPVATFKEKLDAAADPRVCAVVLRINTPGGGVAASDLMRRELQAFRQQTNKPVVASLLDLGAGGGYFLATACDSIVALPSSMVGGIGVVLNLYYAEQGMAQINVFDTSIRSGERIDMGSPVRNLTAEERQLLRSMAADYHDQFKKAVLAGRPRVKADAPSFDGRIMSGPQALAAGLVDSLGSPADAIALARHLAGVDRAVVVLYRRTGDPARTLYATSPNRPINASSLPWSVPGPDRSKLPLFLYLWDADPTMMRLTGM